MWTHNLTVSSTTCLRHHEPDGGTERASRPGGRIGDELRVRAIGLDVHLDFCEMAICEAGVVRSAGRVETSPEVLELFAGSLGREDPVPPRSKSVSGATLGGRTTTSTARNERGVLHRSPRRTTPRKSP